MVLSPHCFFSSISALFGEGGDLCMYSSEQFYMQILRLILRKINSVEMLEYLALGTWHTHSKNFRCLMKNEEWRPPAVRYQMRRTWFRFINFYGSLFYGLKHLSHRHSKVSIRTFLGFSSSLIKLTISFSFSCLHHASSMDPKRTEYRVVIIHHPKWIIITKNSWNMEFTLIRTTLKGHNYSYCPQKLDCHNWIF